MNTIRLHKLDSNYFYFDYEDNIELFEKLNPLLSTVESDPNDLENSITYELLDRDMKDSKLIIKVGFGYLNFVISYFIINDIDYDDSELESNVKPLKILDKWKNILSNESRSVDNKTQYQYLTELIKFNRGVGQLFTGFGKSELLLAIVESYLVANPTKNVVILIPGNKIKDEFISRSEKWELQVKPEYHTFSNRFQLINPVGLLKSKLIEDPNLQDYFNNVGLVLIDEVHHLPSDSYMYLLDKYIHNYDYIYGVSGTVDSKFGEIPMSKFRPSGLSYRLNIIIKYLGLLRIVVKNEISLYVTYLRMPCTYVPDNLRNNYLISLRIFFNSTSLIDNLVTFLNTNPNRRLFIPVLELKQGWKLADRFNEAMGDGTAIFVSSQGEYPELSEEYTDLKDYLNRAPNFRVIIGTSAIYEGFDSNRINTVFLAIGRSQRMTVQPTGRGTRSNDIPMVIFPYDTNNYNPIINSQTRSKFRKIKNEFKNYKFIDFYEGLNE